MVKRIIIRNKIYYRLWYFLCECILFFMLYLHSTILYVRREIVKKYQKEFKQIKVCNRFIRFLNLK